MTTAAANQALAALERYEGALRQLAADWGDMQLYTNAAERLDEVRRCCGLVPALAVQWIELLIANAELVQSVWDSAADDAHATRSKEHLEHVLSCSRVLRDACMQRLPG
jgi:hypothetical protein